MNEPSEDKTDGGPLWEKKISRRDFVDWIIKGGLLATLAGMFFPALEYLWPVMRSGPAGGAQEVGRVDDIPLWGAQKVVLGGSVILLIRTSDKIKAFSASCTHLGCLVDWDDKKREVVCPCHAGLFDLEGRVVSGPPPQPLPSYDVKVVDGKIYVKV